MTKDQVHQMACIGCFRISKVDVGANSPVGTTEPPVPAKKFTFT